jgi:histidinol phosphatase-like PHP family hydrolase
MTCHTKEQLEEMLFDVVNELGLSDMVIEEHGPLGTAPATLVRLVLERKDMEIRMLKAGFVDVTANVDVTGAERASPAKRPCGQEG